jgi:hypothetical protein
MKNGLGRIVWMALLIIGSCGWTSSNLLAETHAGTALKPEALASIVAELQERVRQLEQVQDMSVRISHEAGGSVGLIVGQYIWTDRTGRKPLRYENSNDNSNRRGDQAGQQAVTFEGDGPIVIREFQATGFLVDPSHLLTSAFILAPWDSDSLLDTSENPELIPSIRTLHVYLPGVTKPVDLKIDRASESQDAVVCSLQEPVTAHSATMSSEQPPTGSPILMLGYPGGVEMLTARIPDDVRRELYQYGQPGLDATAEFLAARGYITPTPIQTQVSGQTANRIFFETFGTGGSTGGPIMNAQGQVVAMNQSFYPDYPASNMAIVIAPLQPWIADTISWSGGIFRKAAR